MERRHLSASVLWPTDREPTAEGLSPSTAAGAGQRLEVALNAFAVNGHT